MAQVQQNILEIYNKQKLFKSDIIFVVNNFNLLLNNKYILSYQSTYKKFYLVKVNFPIPTSIPLFCWETCSFPEDIKAIFSYED